MGKTEAEKQAARDERAAAKAAKAEKPAANGEAQDGDESAQGGENQPKQTEGPENQPQTDGASEGAAGYLVGEEDDEAPATATVVPMNNGQTECPPGAKELLLDACERFGVDPTMERRPKELASWNYYRGDRRDGLPASVVVVTAGGVKLRHYADPDYMAPNCTEPAMDQDTEETLARLFSAFKKDAQKNLVRTALPEDLALPEQAVTGFPKTEGHRFRRGYLREGGKSEADRRDAAAKAAKKKARRQ